MLAMQSDQSAGLSFLQPVRIIAGTGFVREVR